jgi:hypothetical protein
MRLDIHMIGNVESDPRGKKDLANTDTGNENREPEVCSSYCPVFIA